MTTDEQQPETLQSHTNSEGERISIHRVRKEGRFKGRLLLVVHDDDGAEAPMLLDEGTRAWLRVLVGPWEGGRLDHDNG